jgi:hypothetical protein
MVKNGYFKDDYVHHFVTKYSRRTPLIHLGYYMRVLTVDFTLRSFLEAVSGQPSQVYISPILENIVHPYVSRRTNRNCHKNTVHFQRKSLAFYSNHLHFIVL